MRGWLLLWWVPLILIFNGSYLYAQWAYKFGAEAGVFTSQGTALTGGRDFLSRLDGQVKYSYEEENDSFTWDLRARPEIFGFDARLESLKFLTALDYKKYEDNYSYGISGLVQRHIYHTVESDINFSNITLKAGVMAPWGEDKSLNFTGGYTFQGLKETVSQVQNMLFFQAGVEKSFGAVIPGAGIYIENFSVKNEVPLHGPAEEFVNEGWRYGPLIDVRYSAAMIINAEYRFLLHSSKVTVSPSTEQQIRLAAGTIFLPAWSLFLLADYYWRSFKPGPSIKPEEINIYYSPADNENRVFIKLGHDLNDEVEAYIKSGYSGQKFYSNSFSFGSWSLTAGIEIRN